MSTDPTPADAGRTRRGGSLRLVPQPVVSPYSRGALPVAESAIPPAERLRLALRGLAIGLASLALSVGLAILLCLALFGNAGLS